MPHADELAHGRRFDLEADQYDQTDPHPVRSAIRRLVVERVIGLGPSQVLDIGCGTGELVLELAPHVGLAVGMDVSSGMLEVGRQKASDRNIGNVKFVFGSFQDGAFRSVTGDEESGLDCITATYSLHHLESPDQHAALRSMCRALGAGGSLAVGDLMLFEDPAGHQNEFERVGYNPANDRPQQAEELVQVVESEGLTVSIESVHPLAGILVGQKK